MKTIFGILLSFIPFLVNAQTINFKIDGVVENTKDIKYAYLSTLSQQIPISSNKVFMMVPIVNGKFEFNGSFNLEGKNIQQASVFLDERGNITKEELALKFKNLIWVSGRDSHLYRVILENLSLHIKNSQEIDKATITNNGTYTQQLYKCIFASRKNDLKGLVDFIKTNNGSPISLLALETVSFFDNVDLKKLNESTSTLFNGLSSQVKVSKDGVELKNKLNIKL